MSSQQIVQLAPPNSEQVPAAATHSHSGNTSDARFCATSSPNSELERPWTGGAHTTPCPYSLDVIFSAKWHRATQQAHVLLRLDFGGFADTVITQRSAQRCPATSTEHAKFLALEQALRTARAWIHAHGHAERVGEVRVHLITNNHLEAQPRRRRSDADSIGGTRQEVEGTSTTHRNPSVQDGITASSINPASDRPQDPSPALPSNHVSIKRQRRPKLVYAKTWQANALREDALDALAQFCSWDVMNTPVRVVRHIIGEIATIVHARQAPAVTADGVGFPHASASAPTGIAVDPTANAFQDAVVAAGLSISTITVGDVAVDSPVTMNAMATAVVSATADMSASPPTLSPEAAQYCDISAPQPTALLDPPSLDRQIETLQTHDSLPLILAPTPTSTQIEESVTITFDGGIYRSPIPGREQKQPKNTQQDAHTLAYGRYRLQCPSLRLDVAQLVVFGQDCTASSDATEYLALQAALSHLQRWCQAHPMRADQIRIELVSDSQNLVQQLKKVRLIHSPEILALYHEIWPDLQVYARWQVSWRGKLKIDQALHEVLPPVRPAQQGALPSNPAPLASPAPDPGQDMTRSPDHAVLAEPVPVRSLQPATQQTDQQNRKNRTHSRFPVHIPSHDGVGDGHANIDPTSGLANSCTCNGNDLGDTASQTNKDPVPSSATPLPSATDDAHLDDAASVLSKAQTLRTRVEAYTQSQGLSAAIANQIYAAMLHVEQERQSLAHHRAGFEEERSSADAGLAVQRTGGMWQLGASPTQGSQKAQTNTQAETQRPLTTDEDIAWAYHLLRLGKTPTALRVSGASQHHGTGDADAALRENSVRTYIEINQAAQRTGRTGPYRIWLICRWLDRAGRGQVPFADLRNLLCVDCHDLTQRHLFNLLAAGEGIFWERYKDGRETFLKLKGVNRVAAALGVSMVRYRATYIPIEHLRAGHGMAEAAMYASFHAARGCDEQHNAPIARQTLSTLIDRSVRTLLNYDDALGIQRRQNIAHTGVVAWTDDLDLIKDAYGPAAFVMYRGRKFGKGQAPEVVMRLPNSYRTSVCIQAQNIGRKKRLNQYLETLVDIRERAERKLADLVESVDADTSTSRVHIKHERMFYADLQQARDMDAALSIVAARARGALAAEQEAVEAGQTTSEAKRRTQMLEMNLRQLQRTLYGFNRVESGVGHFAILGCMPTGGAGDDVRHDAQDVNSRIAQSLPTVRKEYERIRRTRRVSSLKLDVLKTNTDEVRKNR